MFVTNVSTSSAGSKLNAEYYWPQHLNDDRFVQSWSFQTLEQLRVHTAPIAYGVLKPDSLGDRFRVAKAEYFDEMFVSFSNCKPISESMFNEFRRSEAVEGDLLIAIGGYVGRPAIVQRLLDGERLNINRHLARFRPDKNKIDSHYALAYLSSPLGERQLTREITGSVQAGINLEDLRLVKVPIPVAYSQKYIGDKVRQAERLRARARNAEACFKQLILDEFSLIDEQSTGDIRHNRAKPQELTGDLNPGSFNPDRVKIRTYLKANGGRRLLDNASIETPTTASYHSTDRYIGLDSIGSATGTIKPSSIGQEDVVGTVRLLTEGPVISKLRPYLNKVAYIPSELAGSCGSTELLCVRGGSVELNWYLCGVLSLQATVRQLVPVSTGSTHPRVAREDVLDSYVPWIHSPEVAGRKLAFAQRCYVLSDKLVSSAKLLVESLIERKVTENELIDAQTRLEQGDDSADRAILRRLYEGGWDATDTRPLFPDLDAYYETLRMIVQEQSEVASK